MVRAANERTNGFYIGCIVWAVCAVLLIVYDFGVIAFVGSILLAIWVFGLREKFAGEQTASAYSVFNKDGKAIVGGFTASQLDRQLRGTPRSGNLDDPVRGDVAKADTAEVSTKSMNLDEKERLKRRAAAAAAAEKRFATQKVE